MSGPPCAEHNRRKSCAMQMLRATIFLLVAVRFSASAVCETVCVDNLLDLKIKAVADATVASELKKAMLVCRDVTSRGTDVTCPSGFKPTGCSCGMGCGSWDIRTDNTCHCQCAGMDWTSARCCKVAVQG